MVQYFRILLTLATIGVVQAKYLGRFNPKVSGNGGMSTRQSDYYVLDESDDWFTAVSLCQRQVPGSSLLAIESDEEKKVLDAYLDQHGPNSYWTSGRWFSPLNDWIWNVNGLDYPLPPNRPWAPGHPKNPNSQLRVVANYEFGNHSWSTQQQSERHLIICEIASVDTAVPCYKTNDLSVVLDSSGSIGASNYGLAQTFVAKLSRAFTQFGTSRFNFIVYSSGVRSIVPLTNTMTTDQIEQAVISSRYDGGGTNTHLGIEASFQELLSNNRNVPLSMVVLTDGESNSKNLTLTWAEMAVDAGIRTFSVGIGSRTNYEELLAIAGYNKDNMYSLETFDDLIKVLVPISVRLCPN